MKSATEALKPIAAKGGLFITRGDKSGTHVAEMELWGKGRDQTISGAWYQVYEKGAEGNAPTLATRIRKRPIRSSTGQPISPMKDEIKLASLWKEDEALLNFISLIPVNPEKFPRVNDKDTITFVKWLTAPRKGPEDHPGFRQGQVRQPPFLPQLEGMAENHMANKSIK